MKPKSLPTHHRRIPKHPKRDRFWHARFRRGCKSKTLELKTSASKEQRVFTVTFFWGSFATGTPFQVRRRDSKKGGLPTVNVLTIPLCRYEILKFWRKVPSKPLHQMKIHCPYTRRVWVFQAEGYDLHETIQCQKLSVWEIAP